MSCTRPLPEPASRPAKAAGSCVRAAAARRSFLDRGGHPLDGEALLHHLPVEQVDPVGNRDVEQDGAAVDRPGGGRVLAVRVHDEEAQAAARGERAQHVLDRVRLARSRHPEHGEVLAQDLVAAQPDADLGLAGEPAETHVAVPEQPAQERGGRGAHVAAG